ncbi:hypothetical protein O7621_13800 [Solwaraspora sp. WMMD937]|uniref:hypothetical protein n=1 Tax=Solwaraspora sp. WMMD937 TaxID=3016090 RepID=UPI00249B1451|nr:hypothetical protein [Solwaraspora sp. WMMD937]WFE24795.1 hypothetical protein O7621_13800 [Solwaraspora sp. WMMD937]
MPDDGALVCPGDLMALRQCDHVDGKRRSDSGSRRVWPSPEWRSWVLLHGREINAEEPDRNGKAVGVQAYKDALNRPGAVLSRGRRTRLNGRPARISPGRAGRLSAIDQRRITDG